MVGAWLTGPVAVPVVAELEGASVCAVAFDTPAGGLDVPLVALEIPHAALEAPADVVEALATFEAPLGGCVSGFTGVGTLEAVGTGTFDGAGT